MQFYELQAEHREQTGTGVARQLRRQGLLPAVIYGKGVESRSLTVSEKEVDKVLRTKLGQNNLIHLTLKNGEMHKVIIKDYQGDVLTRRLTHVDFMAVREDQKLTVYVPVRTEGKPAGLVQGGLLEILTRELELQCQLGRIPEEIVVDVTNLNIGQNIHLADLTLPEGVTRAEKYNPAIASVYMPKQEVAAVAAPTAETAAVPASAQKAEADKGAAAKGGEAKPAAKPAAKK